MFYRPRLPPLIEDRVHDIAVTGSEVLLYTDHGVVRRKARKLDVEFLRIPSRAVSRFGSFLGVVSIAVVMIFLIPFIIGFWFSMGILFVIALYAFIAIFTAMIAYTVAYVLSTSNPKPVLVIVDEAGAHHYYEIAGNREKLIAIARSKE